MQNCIITRSLALDFDWLPPSKVYLCVFSLFRWCCFSECAPGLFAICLAPRNHRPDVVFAPQKTCVYLMLVAGCLLWKRNQAPSHRVTILLFLRVKNRQSCCGPFLKDARTTRCSFRFLPGAKFCSFQGRNRPSKLWLLTMGPLK